MTATVSESCSPELLQELLAWMTDATTASTTNGSSSIADDKDESVTVSSASSSSSSLTPPIDILSQRWQPCTGALTVGEYLDTRQFPLSYRDLVRRWRLAGSPALHSLRVPTGLSNDLLAEADLCTIATAQESSIIAAISQCTSNAHFDSFISHVEVYAAVDTELRALQNNWTAEQHSHAYEETCITLLEAFASDQSCCRSLRHASHPCIGEMIWGKAFELTNVQQHFHHHQQRSAPFANRDSTFASLAHLSPITPFTPSIAASEGGFGLFPLTMTSTSPSHDQETNPWLDWSALLHELQKTSDSDVTTGPQKYNTAASLSSSSSWQSDLTYSDATPDMSVHDGNTAVADNDNDVAPPAPYVEWLRHYQTLLQETAQQLNTAALLLSSRVAKASNPSLQSVRSFSSGQQQQQQQQEDHQPWQLYTPPMRHHHSAIDP